MSYQWMRFGQSATGLCLVIAALSSLSGCDATKAEAASPAPSTQPASAAVAEAQRENPIDQIRRIQTFAGALDFARPHMTDTQNEISPGVFVLAGWATMHMKLNDVQVAQDETSFARVMKDPDEERGKRLCASGRIIEIHVSKTPFGKITDGLLITGRGNLYSFANVGSSGELVERSAARLCGVVIGTHNYSNSGGGTSHAIRTVGMFVLPENAS